MRGRPAVSGEAAGGGEVRGEVRKRRKFQAKRVRKKSQKVIRVKIRSQNGCVKIRRKEDPVKIRGQPVNVKSRHEDRKVKVKIRSIIFI